MSNASEILCLFILFVWGGELGKLICFCTHVINPVAYFDVCCKSDSISYIISSGKLLDEIVIVSKPSDRCSGSLHKFWVVREMLVIPCLKQTWYAYEEEEHVSFTLKGISVLIDRKEFDLCKSCTKETVVNQIWRWKIINQNLYVSLKRDECSVCSNCLLRSPAEPITVTCASLL